MRAVRPGAGKWSRRLFLASFSPFGLPAVGRKGAIFPSERFRYTDPTTEFPVERLTSPEHASYLPEHYCRFISRKGRFLVYSSNRNGSLQAFRYDTKSGQSLLLTDAAGLDAGTLNLFPDDKRIAYFAGQALCETGIGNQREQRIYEIPEGWQRGEGLGVTADGNTAFFMEKRHRRWRIRRFDLKRRRAETVLGSKSRLSHPMPRPGARSLVFRKQDGELWRADYNGKHERLMVISPGETGPAVWSHDGRSLLYLSYPGAGKLHELRELFASTRQDRRVAKTTQFVSFGANHNTSVFVGASGARVTPYILLMLRVGGREMTLCEHKASDPSRVNPVFAPNSQRIYFQSDRDGENALYSMKVNHLVEPTDS